MESGVTAPEHMQKKYGQYLELVRALSVVGEKLEMVLSDAEVMEIAAPRLGRQNLEALGDVIFAICAQGAKLGGTT